MGTVYISRGRFRRWLGSQFGLDEEGGDRVARRITHGLGALLLIYYVLPDVLFFVIPKEGLLIAALAAAWIIEGLRHAYRFQLPMIRPYEDRRIASFAFYATALAGAVLLFPEPIAAAVILGTALVDPIAGELRLSTAYRWLYPALPFVVYAALAFVALSGIGGWPSHAAAALALLAAAIALAAEYPKVPWVDDDLAMTFAPAIALYVLGVAVLGLPV